MRIDIDRLSEPELVDLNRRVVERLRLLAQMRAHAQMLAFKVGGRVTFRADGRDPVTGMLTRYNRRTVTVIADDGRQWNVAPGFLSKAEPPRPATRSRSNVIALKSR
jgi:hypothetical protein